MSFNNPAVRAAYRQGVKDCYVSSIPHLDPRQERELIDWIAQLEAWKTGKPPTPPHLWGMNVVSFE
jgi:hypothetical protein